MVYLLVRVAGEDYALPVERVREVAGAGELAAVPGAAPVVLGLRNFRGQVIPVIDLAGVLGLARQPRPPYVAIVEHEGRIAALGVDLIRGVGPLDGDIEVAEGRFVTGSSLQDEALVGIIDLDQMLAALEEDAVG